MSESSAVETEHQEVSELHSLHELEPAQARAAITLAHGGTVTVAAAEAGVHRSTIYNWFENDPVFQLAINEIYRERNLRLLDEMRQIETLALTRLRRILEDDTVPASIHLRAAMQVLNRPKHVMGNAEKWSLPVMEDLDRTIEKRPSVLETPTFDIPRQPSTEIAMPAEPRPPAAELALVPAAPADLDITRHSATPPRKQPAPAQPLPPHPRIADAA